MAKDINIIQSTIEDIEQGILILGGEIKMRRLRESDPLSQRKLFDQGEVPLGNMLEELQKVKNVLKITTNMSIKE